MTAPTRYFDAKLGCYVTVCPPGEALGARDLENWSRRRGRGWSGSDGYRERQEAERWADNPRPRTRRHKRALSKRTD